MKLPNRNSAIVPLSKVTDYLLSATHPQGRHKAAFFRSFGFVRDAPEALASALREHAAEHDVADVQDTLFGRRYIVDGNLRAPDGRAPFVRSVWFMELGEDVPRFVTAYPVERKRP